MVSFVCALFVLQKVVLKVLAVLFSADDVIQPLKILNSLKTAEKYTKHLYFICAVTVFICASIFLKLLIIFVEIIQHHFCSADSSKIHKTSEDKGSQAVEKS
ncbi:hypothetical protein NL108_012202 [Boleophthalmus pectinirostris]|nr:hypothetical protein NL108_012202 [Boleophthalmus pectinirostris]